MSYTTSAGPGQVHPLPTRSDSPSAHDQRNKASLLALPLLIKSRVRVRLRFVRFVGFHPNMRAADCTPFEDENG